MRDIIAISIVFCCILGVSTVVQHHLHQADLAKLQTCQNSLDIAWEQNESLRIQMERKDRLLQDAFSEDVSTRRVYRKLVTATAYTAREEECDSTPWVTASMEPSRVGVIAVSRDLEAIGLSLGKTVVIKGMGSFRIEDRMNARWRNRIDILHANLEAARRFAKRDVEIIWLGGKS